MMTRSEHLTENHLLGAGEKGSALAFIHTGRINKTGGGDQVLVEQNACMALRLAKTAYVLEVGKTILKGDAKVVARDEYVTKAYLGY
jgi:branched-chain amino acid transport system ATP-binding protein